MNSIDVVKMGIGNLWTRKVRTFLTILSVIIGTSAIVLIISLGNGIQQTTRDVMEKDGALDMIEVYPGYDEFKEKLLTVKDIKSIRKIEGVQFVAPIRKATYKITTGNYEGYLGVKGVDTEYIAQLKYRAAEGRIPNESDRSSILIGSQVTLNFYEVVSSQSVNNHEPSLPQIDAFNDKFKISLMDVGEEENSQVKKKTMPVKIVGVTGEGQGDLQFDSVMPMKEFDKVGRYFDASFIKKKDNYDEAQIKVNDVSDINRIQDELTEMGYMTFSLEDILESINSLFKILQIVLSGIASISLVIAGIGIANTMMMSVNERRKEIGLMKVVGAKLSDIRSLFLFEASFIGLLGGMIGLSISYGCAAIINQFSSEIFALLPNFVASTEDIGNISIIPWWLSASALGFTTLIGLLSGYLPARRAMRLSALEAIQS